MSLQTFGPFSKVASRIKRQNLTTYLRTPKMLYFQVHFPKILLKKGHFPHQFSKLIIDYESEPKILRQHPCRIFGWIIESGARISSANVIIGRSWPMGKIDSGGFLLQPQSMLAKVAANRGIDGVTKFPILFDSNSFVRYAAIRSIKKNCQKNAKYSSVQKLDRFEVSLSHEKDTRIVGTFF